MSYIGNTPTQQNFVAGADQFSGNGSTVAFTLSRSVNTVFDIFVTVSNVPQDPFTAYTVAGNTLTFDSAPPSGTNNIDVVYRATNVQTFVPTPGVSTQLGLGSAAAPSLTFIGDTNTGIYSPAADTVAIGTGGTEALRVNSSQNVGIGTSSPTTASSRRGLVLRGNANGAELIVQSTSATDGTSDGFALVATGTDAYVYNRLNGFMAFGTNNTERMRISSSGQVTTPNQPAFLATRDSGNQTGLTTNSDLIFASEVYDEGSNYNASTGVFTAPVTGKYLFTCTALFTSITNGQEIDVGLVTSNRLYFFGNPGRLEVSTGVTFGDGYISYGISQIVDMDANDTAFCEIAGLSSGTIALYSGAAWSRFAGYLLG